MNTDQASMPVEEVEDIKDDEAGNNDDMEEYTGASMDIEGQDAEVNMDSDATAVEDVPLKSEAVVESFDEDQKHEDAKEEGQITTATDAEDEREEGELPDEPEQQSDSSPLDIGEQAGDAFRAASPSGAAAKSDADMSEEIVEGDGTAELAEVEPDQSPLAQSGGADASPSRTTDASPVREPSPSNPAIAGASSEQQNPGTAAENVGRTINLTERAIQNRTNRQNRLVRTSTPQPSSSRGRSRETGRGRGRSRRGGQP